MDVRTHPYTSQAEDEKERKRASWPGWV